MLAQAITAVQIWESFREALSQADRRLASDIRARWTATQNVTARQIDGFARAIESRYPQPSLDALERIVQPHCRELLLGPVEEERGPRPSGSRALFAFEEYDQSVLQLIDAVPETLVCSGAEWLELIGPRAAPPLARARLRGRRTKPIALRGNLLLEFHLSRRRRMKVQGQLERLLSDARVDMLAPWHALLSGWLSPWLNQSGSRLDAELAMMRERARRRRGLTEHAIGALEAWLAREARVLAFRAALRAAPSDVDVRVDAIDRTYSRYQEFWLRQARAVEADVDLDVRLAQAVDRLLTSARDMLASLAEERRELLSELDAVLTWLDDWKPGDSNAFPTARADVLLADQRQRTWAHTVDAIALGLPESVEVSSRVAGAPRLWSSWRIQAPRRLFQAALESKGAALIRQGLVRLEQQHQGIVREIERGREVVSFAFDSAHSGPSVEHRIEEEGIDHVRSLLRFHRRQTAEVPAEIERSLVLAVTAVALHTHRFLEEGQFGLAREATRYGLPRAVRVVWRRIAGWARAALDVSLRRSHAAYRELLIRIGWLPAPTSRGPHVVSRSYLTQAIGSASQVERLPMIYQRLFQLAPVQDSRFLIGRRDEMAAFREARDLWQKGRGAGVLVVGERGSGKTSLINCAIDGAFADVEVVRTEFVERLTAHDDLHLFVARMLNTDVEGTEQALRSRRRVIVIEELERAFLRKVGHYGAIRALLNLISATSRDTLWIVSMNYFAFRLLNALLRLDQYFSHRINAMAVERQDLREAILMRHHLSGLRLRFAPPPEGRSLEHRLRTAAGVRLDADDEFFDVLYGQSGGVFRTAFALWLRYIDRAEAGVLHMTHASSLGRDQAVRALSEIDLLTLAALLQHGSLNAREHSVIFQVDEATSHAWLANLGAQELIEPDPGRAGLRVVPEAGQLVRETLFRRNLA